MVTSKESLSFLWSRAENYVEMIAAKSEALVNCVGFIGGTVIGIACHYEA